MTRLTLGGGTDVICFNRGDGLDTLNAPTSGAGLGERNDTLSLGGVGFSQLQLSRDASDLLVKVAGTSDVLRIKSWYLGSTSQTINRLQIVVDSTAEFVPGGTDVLRSSRLCALDFVVAGQCVRCRQSRQPVARQLDADRWPVHRRTRRLERQRRDRGHAGLSLCDGRNAGASRVLDCRQRACERGLWQCRADHGAGRNGSSAIDVCGRGRCVGRRAGSEGEFRIGRARRHRSRRDRALAKPADLVVITAADEGSSDDDVNDGSSTSADGSRREDTSALSGFSAAAEPVDASRSTARCPS